MKYLSEVTTFERDLESKTEKTIFSSDRKRKMFSVRSILLNFLLMNLFLSKRSDAFGSFRQRYVRQVKHFQKSTVDPGTALFLTPLIEQGSLDLARNLSFVEIDEIYRFPSFSGFLTVNQSCNSNLFFWFFPSQNERSDSPLVIWLQGGPGTTSTFALFSENGPIGIDENEQVFLRNFSWNLNNHVLYVDQPVGTGFSFTDDDRCYAKDEEDVSRDFYSMLIQFFQLFPLYLSSDVYISGESYAGKFVTSIFYKIRQENNDSNKLKVNLKGLMIGNGLIDPLNQWEYGPAMFQMGLIDERGLDLINLLSLMARQQIEQGQFRQAYSIFNEIFDGIYSNETGLIDAENLLRTNFPDDMFYFIPWLIDDKIRRKIHVGNLSLNNGERVVENLENDAMKSIVDKLRTIADGNDRILIYNGLLDLIIPSASTSNWIELFQWKGADDFRRAKRNIWKVEQTDRQVAGYLKQSNNFYFASIRNGGHSAPYDQPRSTYFLIDAFINKVL